MKVHGIGKIHIILDENKKYIIFVNDVNIMGNYCAKM